MVVHVKLILCYVIRLELHHKVMQMAHSLLDDYIYFL